jgi:hypothetical protein
MYRIETISILNAFQNESATGLQNRFPRFPGGAGLDTYSGVVFHNHWLGLTLDEITAKLEKIEPLVLGPTVQVDIAGLQGTQMEATVNARAVLWSEPVQTAQDSFWMLEPGQMMRFIVLETPAGSLLVTIGADADEWEDFLPVAEEILAGISFPDFD